MITHRIRPPAWLLVLLLAALATLTGSSSVVLAVRLAGLLIVALGIPVYLLWRRADRASAGA